MTISETANILQSIADLGQAEQEFNIVKDLKALERIKSKGFKLAIEKLIKKYETDENTLVHAALMKRCSLGDMAAIKMFRETQQNSYAGNEVQIIDDI